MTDGRGWGGLGRGGLEAVTYAADGLEVIAGGAELTADGAHVDVDVAVDDDGVVADDLVEELIAGKDATGAEGEHVEEAELGGGELHG